MKVQDLMTKNPVTISPDATVDEAWHCINRFRIWALPVINQGKIVGIVTKSDLKRRSQNGRQKIYEIMTTNPLAISMDKQVSVAEDIMQYARINALLVTEDEKLIGIITRYDIYKKSLFISGKDQKLGQIKKRIEEWKNEGYDVSELEIMVESLEKQKIDNQNNM
jgi:CBS domain-containing protein